MNVAGACNKKVILSIIIAVMVALSMIPSAVSAAETDTPKTGFYLADGTKLPDHVVLNKGEVLKDVKVYYDDTQISKPDCFYRTNSSVINLSDFSRFKFTITPARNGEVKLICKYDFDESKVAVLDITVTGCDETADPNYRAPYDRFQGGETVNDVIYYGAFLNEYDVYTAPYNELIYENYITNAIDSKEAVFDLNFKRFTKVSVAISEENKYEVAEQGICPYIKLKDMDGNTVASLGDGNLFLKDCKAVSDNELNIQIQAEKGILTADKQYQLIIEKGVYLHEAPIVNHIPIIFNFKTKPFVYATEVTMDKTALTLDVNQKSQLSASAAPEDADDYEFTWSSSDAKVAKVAQDGTVTAVKAGTAVITAKNANGKAASCKVTVKPVPVAAVTGIAAKSIAHNKINVKWKKVSGASEYTVYTAAKKNGKYKKVKTVKGNTCNVSNLKLGKRYYCKVRAAKIVNGTKYTGPASKAASAVPTLKTTALKATGKNGRVYLSWSKVACADKYQIYKTSKGKNGKYYKLRQTVKLKFTDKNVRKGKTYYYKARSYKQAGGKRLYSRFTTPVKVTVK